MTGPTCPSCDEALGLEELLAGASGYSVVTNSGGSVCPSCHATVEFRIGPGCLEFGYTYWAGSLHFEGVSTFPVPGLRLVVSGESLVAALHGRSFPLTQPNAPSES